MGASMGHASHTAGMSIARANARQSSAVVAALQAQGIDDVIISPGARNAPLVLAIAAQPSLRTTVITDERVAAFFALGLARTRGQPVALVCTSGSAGTHYFPAVAEASGASVPLLLITADRPAELHHCGAPQTMPQADLYGTHVRRFYELPTPCDDVPAQAAGWIIAQAVHATRAPIPGPVHVNAPFREPLWHPDAHHDVATFASPRIFHGPASLPDDAWQTLAEDVASAQRGVIVAGPADLGARTALHDAASAFARHARWPIIAEITSPLRTPWSEPVITAGDALLRCPRFAERQKPDRVICFGQPPTSKAIVQWLHRHAAGRMSAVRPWPLWQDPTHGLDRLVVAPPAEFCREMLRRTPERRENTWLRAWQDADARAREVIDGCAAGQMWEGPVVAALVAAMPAGALIHAGNSMAVRDLDTFAPRRTEPLQVLANRGVNGIDGVLSSALGAAMAQPGTPMFVLTGDLAFAHDVAALRLGVELGLSATVVVLNNGGGGIFDHLPLARSNDSFTRFFTTPSDLDIGRMATASGARWRRAESSADLLQICAEEVTCAGIGVIEARFDHTKSAALHRDVWSQVQHAIDGEANLCR